MPCPALILDTVRIGVLLIKVKNAECSFRGHSKDWNTCCQGHTYGVEQETFPHARRAGDGEECSLWNEVRQYPAYDFIFPYKFINNGIFSIEIGNINEARDF